MARSYSLRVGSFPPVNRGALTPGAYIPDSSLVRGLIPGQPITDIIYPTNQSTAIPLNNSSYENTIFWGQITHGTAPAPELSNCIAAGFDQDTLTGGLSGNYKSFDSATVLRPHVTFYDSLISCAPWTSGSWGAELKPGGLGRPLAPGDVREISGNSAGIHGGGVSLIRTLVEDVQDCLNLTNGHAQSFNLIDSSEIAKAYFRRNWAPGGGWTHSDLVQFNRGKNTTVQHSLLGGARVQADYDLAYPQARNSGRDAYGAAAMCKQEAGWTAYDQIVAPQFIHNWFRGCGHVFNMVYVAARPYLWDDCVIADNLFSNNPAYLPEVGYIEKSNQLTPIVTGNTILETGAPVTAHNTNYSE